MRIEVQIRHDDPSIAPLREAWHAAARRHEGRLDALAASASERYAQIAHGNLPSVVREPLALVPAMARMLSGANWDMDVAAREHVVGALAYFVDPNDLIPDDEGHFGFLDDAMVIKLALAEAQHEWFAWCDFSDYLEAHPDEHGIDRETWMQRRRDRFEASLRRRVDPGHSASSVRPVQMRADAGRYAPNFDAPPRFGVR